MEEKKKQAYQVGMAVFLVLASLTIGEFFIGAVAYQWWAPLLGIALLKAYFVVRDYMHLSRVFSGEEENA